MWPRVVPAGLLCKTVGAKSLSGRGYKSSFQPKSAQSLQDQEKSEAKNSDFNSSAGCSARELGCQSHSPGIVLHPDVIQKLKQRSSPIAWSTVYSLEVSGK